MSPTERQCWSVVRHFGNQTAEPGVTIDLKQPAEALQMDCRMLALTILTINIGSRRMTWSRPGTVVDSITPQPSGLGAAAAGSSTGRVVSSATTLGEDRTVLKSSSYS